MITFTDGGSTISLSHNICTSRELGSCTMSGSHWGVSSCSGAATDDTLALIS